jgi:uncharacterized membrane protein YfcA
MDTVVLIAILSTFLLAGMIKGVIGLGLPTVSLAVLTVVLGLPQAMALLLVPSFLTNVWQAAVGGNATTILKRIWPFILMATVTVWIGAIALTTIDLSILSALLGLLLITYAVANLAGVRFSIPARHEIWAGTALGTANGILTGMTGSFVVPGVMFLQAIGLPRDTLIQAMGILFTASTIALAVSLGLNGLISPRLGVMSMVAVVPAIAGMVAGQKIRKRLSEVVFRKVFFISLLGLGFYITANAISSLV